MPIISRADFSRLAGVSRAAITQATKANPPKLALEADGTINTDLPMNRAWLDAKRSGKTIHTPKQVKTKGDTVSPRVVIEPTEQDNTADSDPDGDIAAILEGAAEKLKLTKARRQQAEADTHLKNIRINREKGILIPRDLVRRKFSAFDASLKTNFRDMPRRIAAQVHAIALAGDAREVEAYLEKEISQAIGRATIESQKLDFN